MKFLVFVIVFLSSFTLLFSNGTPNITMEYLTTDYNGIVSNGSSVLCYGTNGIITRSTDKGNTWHRVSVSNRYHIKKMDTIGSVYVGIAKDGIIVSKDNGLIWDILPIMGGIDICHSEDSMYILTERAIHSCTFSTLNSPKEILALDTFTQNRNLIIANNNLHWIEDDRYIVNYSQSKKKINKVYIDSLYISPASRRFEGLQSKENILYAAVVEDRKNGTVSKLPDEYCYIVFSEDSGNSWMSFSQVSGIEYKCNGISNFTTLNDSTVLALRTKNIIRKIPNQNSLPWQNFLVFEYVKFYSSGTIETINNADTIPHMYAVGSDQRIKNFIRVDNNTLIGAGNNHCIVRTADNGLTWNFISYFPLLSEFNTTGWFRSTGDSSLYMPSMHGVFYKTHDAGTTILPQKFHFYPQCRNASVSFSHFNGSGKGCIIMNTPNELDSNVFITKDYGETYKPVNNIALFHDHKDSLIVNQPKLTITRSSKIIETQNNFLLYGTPTYKDSIKYVQHPYSVIVRLSKDYNLIDTIHIPVNTILSLVVYDNIVYVIGMNLKDRIPKTNIEDIKEFPRYTLFRLVDEGKTWEVITDSILLPNEVQKVGNLHYVKQFALQPNTVFNKRIVLTLRPETLLLYSLEQQQFDTLSLPFSSSPPLDNTNTLFDYKGSFGMITRGNNIVFTQGLKGESTVWDSVPMDQLMYWDYTKNTGNNANYTLGGFLPNSMNNGYITINELKGVGLFGAGTYKVHLARYFPRSASSTVEMGNGRPYLWNSEPFPQPTRGEVSTKVYWDMGYSAEDVSVSVTNILGATIRVPNTRITPIQQTAALFTFNVSNVPTGIYILRLQLKNEVRVMPFMVVE